MPGPLNSLAIAMVKNEADIIEAFVRHNLHYVDLLVVIDNLSTDGTREILLALRREGLPVLLIDDPVFGHFQSEKVTHAYRKVVPIFQPQIVYLLDADEFLRAPSRDALDEFFGNLQPGTIALLPWMTYMPVTGVDPESVRLDPLGMMERRRRVEEPTYYKAVICRRPQDDDELVIDQGNHSARLANGRGLPSVIVSGAGIAHLPVRSVDQLTAKAINGWHACMVRNRHRNVPGEAYQWQTLYQQIIDGHQLDAATLETVALGYAQTSRPGRSAQSDTMVDPLPALYGELKYLELGRHSALAKVALSVAGMLESPQGRAEDGPPLDLAPVIDLLAVLQARRLATTASGREWSSRLSSTLKVTPVSLNEHADVLLAPDLRHCDSLKLAGERRENVCTRIVLWPDSKRSSESLREELKAWTGQGWEPDLMQTMTMRAISSFAVLRQGALVLRPLDTSQPDRAQQVSELLCSLCDAPSNWVDPRPQCIQHPLQGLELGQSVPVLAA